MTAYNQWEGTGMLAQDPDDEAAARAAGYATDTDKPGAMLDESDADPPPATFRDDGIARAARRTCGIPEPV